MKNWIVQDLIDELDELDPNGLIEVKVPLSVNSPGLIATYDAFVVEEDEENSKLIIRVGDE